ncbi:MAG: DUF2959 family protein [Pseudomonadota bacterium]|nr:DUF2959 family protein [Pseudomonadota bacterium]
MEHYRGRRSSVTSVAEGIESQNQLIRRTHDAEDRREPVLQAFEDQVLYLKHNLNAQAIGALENELATIRQDG